MTYSTQDAQRFFEESLDEETVQRNFDLSLNEETVSIPEHTHSSIRIAVLECETLVREGYSEDTIDAATIFTVEHGASVPEDALHPAKIRATLRPKKFLREVVRGTKKYRVFVIA